MVGLFREWQPRYAEHRVATFPVESKRPCIRAGTASGRGALLNSP